MKCRVLRSGKETSLYHLGKIQRSKHLQKLLPDNTCFQNSWQYIYHYHYALQWLTADAATLTYEPCAKVRKQKRVIQRYRTRYVNN